MKIPKLLTLKIVSFSGFKGVHNFCYYVVDMDQPTQTDLTNGGWAAGVGA